MGLNENNATPRSGCSRPLKGCAIIAAVLCLAFIGLMIWLFRNPNVRNLVRCTENMVKVGDALRRYHDVNNKYPPDLESLKKDYLKDPGVLQCPVGPLTGDDPNYTYHAPPADAKESFVVLECARHVFGRGSPPIKLRLRLDGSMERGVK
ncbi:MAG: hypothetical protein M1133_05155 [Armatimonadetes bacterium]|nr:hypothetical protein [Armatimonadota bacterium]